ncbi:MAG: FkbM family methyltransferase [Jatrophihabitans sp.]|uniref:FkbM family methyltransferase n=1 Tax=Jatrophihabitans sp. TaxID=1932789 RepID=UPI00390F720A
MTVADRLDAVRHEGKRVVQTTRTFANWRPLLGQMTAQRFGRGPDELTFRVKGGPTLSSPNVPGARLPLYEQFADDCYRLGELLAPLQGRPLQVLDVGAHIGSFAVHVATVHPRARIECYEPSPSSARFLQRNVDQNGLGGRISVHEAALADKRGMALLDDNDGGSVHNGLMQADHRLVAGQDALDRRHAIEVPTTTFDDAVAAAPAPPDVVKMDCEGGEYALVYASSDASWASVRRIVMEYHPVKGESWDELRGWFERLGLRVTRHESDSPGLGTAWLARPDSDSSRGTTA